MGLAGRPRCATSRADLSGQQPTPGRTPAHSTSGQNPAAHFGSKSPDHFGPNSAAHVGRQFRKPIPAKINLHPHSANGPNLLLGYWVVGCWVVGLLLVLSCCGVGWLLVDFDLTCVAGCWVWWLSVLSDPIVHSEHSDMFSYVACRASEGPRLSDGRPNNGFSIHFVRSGAPRCR